MITVAMLVLSGCATMNKIIPGNFCDVSQAHLHSAKAQRAMSDSELATETKHNDFGAKECGWKPPRS